MRGEPTQALSCYGKHTDTSATSLDYDGAHPQVHYTLMSTWAFLSRITGSESRKRASKSLLELPSTSPRKFFFRATRGVGESPVLCVFLLHVLPSAPRVIESSLALLADERPVEWLQHLSVMTCEKECM